MGISKLGYVGVGVSDVASWQQFATEVLGLEISERAEDGTLYLRMDEHYHRLAVHPGGQDDITHVGWEVPDAQSLDGVIEKLEDLDVNVTRGTQGQRGSNEKSVTLSGL
ncbi:MAG: hypothetical protein GTO40_19890 [Deltaproteobacteria bacterium]|nr:hypothetical protein [Deltaproteobacteria bacterium]